MAEPDRRNYWWVGVILALLVQTAALFYWGGTLAAAVESNRAAAVDHETRLRTLESERYRQIVKPAADSTRAR